MARTFDALAPPRRRLRRGKAKDADPDASPAVPVTAFTIIEADPIEGDGTAWLDRVRSDGELQEALADRGLAHARRAMAARRLASADAAVPDPSWGTALVSRIGYGKGDALVDGRYEEAIELPHDEGKRGVAEALRPQERMAAILGGREQPLACEELILRARADLDAGRGPEAALQLRVGLEALLAAREAFAAPRQADDLALLDERRRATGDAANEALAGPLAPLRLAEVAETVTVCQRLLRRRAARG